MYISLNQKFNNPMHKTAGIMDAIRSLISKPKVGTSRGVVGPTPFFSSSRYTSPRVNTRAEELKKSLPADFGASLEVRDAQVYNSREKLRDAVQRARSSSGNIQNSAEEIAKAKAELARNVKMYNLTTDTLAKKLNVSPREFGRPTQVNQEFDRLLHMQRR